MSRDMTIQELLQSLTPVVHQKKPMQEPATLDLSETAKAEVKEQKRCGFLGSCKKKLLLTDFACTKCSTRYCGAHRIPEEHACSFDFRKEGQAILAKQNPRVVNSKLDQI